MKEISRFWFFFLLFCSSLVAKAGVKDFDRKISLALVSVNHQYNLNLRSEEENIDSEVSYRANTASLSGGEISYKWLTLAYLTSNVIEEKDLETKGETSYEDLRGALFLGKKKNYVLLGYYNRYKGFFIDNTREIDSSADLYLQRDDIETFNSGASLMYIFDPSDFSAAAAFVQSAQQTSSGGSWLLMLSFDVNLISGAGPLVPVEIRDDFGTEQELEEGEFATTNLSLGYGYTLVWKKAFLNLTALIGRGVQQKRFKYGDEEQNLSANASKFAMGYSLGYNGDWVYFGLSFVQDNNNFTAGSVKVSPRLSSNRIFLGVRF